MLLFPEIIHLAWLNYSCSEANEIQTYVCNGQLVNTNSLAEEINKKSQARIKIKFKNSKD